MVTGSMTICKLSIAYKLFKDDRTW